MTDRGPLVRGYLARLDLPPALPANLDTLTALHRRHLDRVPYDNLAIMLGAPPSVDPTAVLRGIVEKGRAGYCFHHNGALELVLRELGYVVRRWHGHGWTRPEDRATAELNHLVLEVSDLPDESNPGGRWWVDAGLGDGFIEPLPIIAGRHHQAPFAYTISDITAHGWSFGHDPRGSLGGIEVSDLPIDQVAVETVHGALSTPPDGTYTRISVVQRRRPGCTLTLRGVLLTVVDDGGATESTLTSYDEWRGALVDVLGLPIDDLPADGLRDLHARMVLAHRAWEEAGRP